MPIKRPLTYRELLKRLKRYGVMEEPGRGKGSERMLIGVVDGRLTRIPTKCHRMGDEKPVAVIESIRRRFRLTVADGISDKTFYGR